MKRITYQILSYTSLIITLFYGTINLIGMVIMEIEVGDAFRPFIEMLLSIDLFTWLVYGIFTITTFIMKISSDSERKEQNKLFDVNVILHLLFMVISFIGIYYMFTNCF